MIVYNVTVKVDNDIHDDWLAWMTKLHIPDVMDAGYFSNYRISRLIEHGDDEAVTYSIQYTCASMKDLHHYQINEARQLQKEHAERYVNKYVAFRSIMEVVDEG